MKRYLIKLTLILAAGFTIGHFVSAYDWLWRGPDETSLSRLGYHQGKDSYIIDSPYTRIAVSEFGHFGIGDNLPPPAVGATIHLDSDFESTYALADNNDGQLDGVTWKLGAINRVAAHPNTFAVREYGSDRAKVIFSLADWRQPMHYHVYQDLDRDGKIDTLREVRDGEFGQWHIFYDELWRPATPNSEKDVTYGVRHPENDELIILVQLEGSYWKTIPDEVFTIEEFAQELGLEHEE